MLQQSSISQTAHRYNLSLAPTAEALNVEPLENKHQAEALSFLSKRPLHTVIMAGMIRDNGLDSPLNRGAFYACTDSRSGQLEGIALIGHATLFETRTERALEALSRVASKETNTRFLLGEQKQIKKFWKSYSEIGRDARLVSSEQLLELRSNVESCQPVEKLRRAAANELDLIVPVQAQMYLDQSGINPLDTDPQGFRRRCARRIEQGRTWVWVENNKLIFKAEVQCDTPQCVYLEGIWVNPDERGKGYGMRCLSQMVQSISAPNRSICLLAKEQNSEASNLYQRLGFNVKAVYDTLFLQPEEAKKPIAA